MLNVLTAVKPVSQDSPHYALTLRFFRSHSAFGLVRFRSASPDGMFYRGQRLLSPCALAALVYPALSQRNPRRDVLVAGLACEALKGKTGNTRSSGPETDVVERPQSHGCACGPGVEAALQETSPLAIRL